MTMSLLSGAWIPTGATATTAAAGYPASALSVPGVLRGWRTTGIGAQSFTLDLGVSRWITGIGLQAVAGALSGNPQVYADNAATPTTLRGNVTLASDGNGRRKGSLQFSATARYVRVVFTVSSGVLAVGYAPVFGTLTAPPRDPLFGQTRIICGSPQGKNELANGIVEVYDAGPATTDINLAFALAASQSVDFIRSAARAGPCWLDLGLPQRGLQWPVRHVDAQVTRSLDRYNRETQQIALREIT